MGDLDGSDHENEKVVSSVLEGEGYYFNKILNRGASTRSGGSSNESHIHVNVPFEWETQPGTPKASETTSMEKNPQIIRPPPFSTKWEGGGDLSVKSSMKGWTGLVFWRTKKHRNRNMRGRKSVDKRRSFGGRRNQLGFGSDDIFATSSSSSSYNWSLSSSSSPPALGRNNDPFLPSTSSKLRGVSKRLIKWPF